MPEGPEIKREADKLGAVLAGQVLTQVRTPWPGLTGYERIWQGQEILSVRARGKALLTCFANGDILYSHNQLYGRWMTRKSHKEPSTRRSLRISLCTEIGSAYLYSATDIEVLREADLAEHPYLSQLGPDVLSPDFRVAQLNRRLVERSFVNRQLGTLLLDQKFLAGPGNYLRSEILFESGLHPRLRPSDLDTKSRTRLSRTILKICRRAYEQQGTTVEPKLVKKLKAQGQKKRQYRHYVFFRQGRPCRRCQAKVMRFNISSRAVFMCPQCQALPEESA